LTIHQHIHVIIHLHSRTSTWHYIIQKR